jgi:hypothetical protein
VHVYAGLRQGQAPRPLRLGRPPEKDVRGLNMEGAV